MCARSNVCAFRIGFVAAYMNVQVCIFGLILSQLRSIYRANFKFAFAICVHDTISW